jgi:FkbM family methyltransferase
LERLGKMSYSQIGQDVYYIENISKYKRNGIFLDIGANDGIYTSNTAKLEFEYGWSGICIEANSDLIPELIKNRPNSKIVNSAVWSSNTNLIFEIPESNYKDIKGNLLSRISGIPGNEKHFKNHFNSNVKTVNLSAKTVTEILEGIIKFPITIDYMSLDVEGAELEVLKGIDFNKIEIKFMTVEHGDRLGYADKIIEFLKDYGYKVHRFNRWDIELEK